MVYAIIDATSDISELITIAYGETASELARWFIDEVNDTADMYLSAEEDFRQLEDTCKSLEVLCEDTDSSEVSDIDGITIEISDISVAIIGAYYNYEDMKAALEQFISDKPKFKKVTVPDNVNESIKVIDELNSALIRCAV